VPEDALMPVMLTHELTLRDSHDEVWTTTDKNGRFLIESPDEGYRIALISQDGFALAAVPPVGEVAELTLAPLVQLSLEGVDGSKQKLDLTIRLPDLPQSASTLSIYSLELESTAITLELPPGVITVSRSFDQGNGSSIAVPAETMTLSAGQKKSLKLAPKTLEEVRPN
jgi:hypothetical protein